MKKQNKKITANNYEEELIFNINNENSKKNHKMSKKPQKILF